MYRVALVCTLLITCASAQLTFPQRPSPRQPASPIEYPPRIEIGPDGRPTYVDEDARLWAGPLVAIPGENTFYRTFSGGSLMPSHRELNPTTMLAGFEITAHDSSRGSSVNSLQPFYILGNGRVAGARVGTPAGARTQLLARDGYAVRSMRCGAMGPRYGLEVTFGRIQADGSVSGTDIYKSAAIGRPIRVLDGGGVPFCGTVVNGRDPLAGFALLVSQPLVQKLQPALTPSLRNQTTTIIPGIGAQPGGLATTAPPPASSPIPGLPSGNPTAAAAPPALSLGSPPGAPGVPADPVDALADGRLGELVRSAAENLVFVEGADGQGSGFICQVNGKRVLLTNQHVISGSPNVRFTTLTQSEVKVGPARAAAAHDLIAYDAPDTVSALEAAPDFAQTVAVGDEVVVLGNTEGARVIKPLPGRLVGVGPDLVEISSAFLPGNSGSPIIHLKSGKVIGIATYALIRKVNSLTGAPEPSVRRFGYRLDSVQNWQPVNWQIYQAEAAAAKKVIEFSNAIIDLLMDVRSGRFDPSRHTDSRLRPAVSQLATLTTRKNINQADRMRIVQNFLGDLRNVAQRDVDDLRPRLRYDYFQRELAEEGKFRAEIHTGLGEAIRKLR